MMELKEAATHGWGLLSLLGGMTLAGILIGYGLCLLTWRGMMDKNWRPDDWENPEKDALQGPAILNDVERACLTYGSHAYERGANAMLKARDAYLASQVGPCPEDTCEAMKVFGYCEKECHKCAHWQGQQAGLAQGQAALESDAADLWRVTNAIKAAIEAREWIVDGRGPYEWNDDRYKEEAGHAFTEVLDLIKQVQPPASKRFHEAMTGALEKRLEAEIAQGREEIMLGLKKLGYGAALVELESYLEEGK